MTDSVVVEGYVKFRDGKKWKTRWVVLRKPSPVADCLVLLVFKDKSDKAQGHRERGSFTLEDICGLEPGQWYEGVSHTLAIVCLAQATLLGFDSKEALQAWEIRIRYSLGEVHRFIVGVLPGTKLESGPATLHLCNNLLALARDIPPVVSGHWNLPDLRRYGPVPNGFVFEGGTRCGYWAGVFFLASADGEQISFLFDCIVRGISPSRGPYGLQPVLPPDPCANKAYSEERANHEAQELEKRLSMLSHRSSTALSVYNPCSVGDDRSISGSSDTSDTSRSDCSIGSRLAVWPEPPGVTSTAGGPSSSPSDSIAGQTGPKAASSSQRNSTEKLSIIGPGGGGGGGCRVASSSKAPRQLQEIGRQSSSDSGIATGSHSSYTGSFSSYTGSLDIATTAVTAEEFGSTLTLPPHLAAADLSPCTCPVQAQAPPVPGHHEYQVPTSLRYLYDTPRSVLLQEGSGGAPVKETETEPHADAATKDCSEPLSGAGSDSCSAPADTTETETQPPAVGPPQEPSEEDNSNTKSTESAPTCNSQHPIPDSSCRMGSSHLPPASKNIFTICSACGGFKGTPYTPGTGCAVIPAIPDKKLYIREERHRVDPSYEVMESRAALERNSETEDKIKYELMATYGPQRHLHDSEGPVFVFPPELPFPDRPRGGGGGGGDGVTYVNIPISPTSKREINYMELELQESCPGIRVGAGAHLLPPQRRGSSNSKYAQIDIAATETAHKVGTQHALGREEGLHTLDLRRRGVPQ